MRIFLDNIKEFFTFLVFHYHTVKLFDAQFFMFYILDSIFVSKARNSEIYTTFTTRRKQHTKVGLQGTEMLLNQSGVLLKGH
jgi:hypothetical protein